MQRVPKNDAFYDRADFPQGDGDGKENHNLYFISGVNTLNTLNTLGSVKICVRQDLRATTQAFQATALRDIERTARRRGYCATSRLLSRGSVRLSASASARSSTFSVRRRVPPRRRTARHRPALFRRSLHRFAEACALPQKKVDEALLLIDNQIKPFTNNLKNITDPGYVPVHPKSFQLLSEQSSFSALACSLIAFACATTS